MNVNNSHLCRICISSNENCTQMISIFGEDSLWKKITTLADVKIERGDTLPQQVCVNCAKNAISACLFKKKCEDADNFFRQQLLIQKIEGKMIHSNENSINSIDKTNDNDGGLPVDSKNSYGEAYHAGARKCPQNNDFGGQRNMTQNGEVEANQFNGYDDVRQPHESYNDEMVDESGEIKCANGGDKPPFDFHSIRLMHEYMQQQLKMKFNGNSRNAGGSHSAGSISEDNADDEEPLPLIPEIELITPSEDMHSASAAGNGTVVGTDAQGAPLRGYQCPNCYQIFEMKQILKAHMQSVHGTAGPVYECSNCKKTYFYKRFLEKHVRRGRCVKKRRNQTRPMQCSDCHVLFPTGHHLGWHKRTGCPSRAAKMPLQQLFKQNIVQYNNFPKRIGIRKPENAIYLHNRKLMMANKRKGRTRIKLDAKKIALAKQLILREATTTVIANELNISRTFAWRLRKSLVNGVSLHERVIDPNAEEQPQELSAEQQMLQDQQQKGDQQAENAQQSGVDVKSDEEDDDHDDDDVDDDGIEEEEEDMEADGEEEIDDYQHPSKLLMHQLGGDHDNELNDQYSQLHQTAAEVEVGSEENERQEDEEEVEVEERMIGKVETDDAAKDKANILNTNPTVHHQLHQQQQEQEIFLRNMALHGIPTEKVAEAAAVLKDLKYQKSFMNGGNGLPLLLPTIHPYSAGLPTPMSPLPVNLSIRPIASMQKKEVSSQQASSIAGAASTTSGSSHQTKKPRKPNVFIDDEKYAMAQTLVAQNASTMEIARALNVSQMTAWKVRDAIIKGVPLSYRNKRGDVGVSRLSFNTKPEEDLSETQNSSANLVDPEMVREQLRLQMHQHQQQQQQQQHQEEQHKLLERQLLEKQRELGLLKIQRLQKEQQLNQQLLETRQRIRQEVEIEKAEAELADIVQQQPKLLHDRTQALQMQTPSTSSSNTSSNNLHYSHNSHSNKSINNNSSSNKNNHNSTNNNDNHTKLIHPRRRLKAAEREQRDKEITREILELIKEDSNIQYWKVSARLAEKGYPISPSSVCQKLKSMGIHRRWKPGDKPPLMMAPGDMEQHQQHQQQLKTNLSASAATSVANSSADESYEQQFELGGPHFLSAFTR